MIRITELEKIQNEPDFWNDRETSEKVINELKELRTLTTDIAKLKENLKDNLELLDIATDDEINELINIEELTSSVDKIEILLLLSGEYDGSNCTLEIHSGAGGTEACDWAMMLYRMYTRYCEKHNLKTELIDFQEGEEVGVKSATLLIKGKYAYGYLKGEKGVHRLVRLSPFDSNNKRHTSFASIDVIPEFDNTIDITIDEKDLKIDVYRSSGCGGQGVNTTDSAVRVTHIPTGTVVTCQNERSQIKNKARAIEVLKARLYDAKIAEEEQKAGRERKSKIGTGDRAEKIRTYNYPQNRVTDHRIGFTTKQLDRVMNGDMEEIIEALITEDQRLKLSGEEKECL